MSEERDRGRDPGNDPRSDANSGPRTYGTAHQPAETRHPPMLNFYIQYYLKMKTLEQLFDPSAFSVISVEVC